MKQASWPVVTHGLLCAVTNNLTVIRAFAFVVQEGYNMQLSDGTYNESLLVAMDNVVAEASTRGLKLIMALANNWNYNSNMSDTKCVPHLPFPCSAAASPAPAHHHNSMGVVADCSCVCVQDLVLGAGRSGQPRRLLD